MTYLSCACGKRYDVTGRAPGMRVKCRACDAVLVVPAPRASAGAITASERLRAARGAPCARHPRALASHACEECQDRICEECRAPRPATHLCRECARKVAATTAVPLDFGLLATPLIAARLAARAIGRLFTFTLLANLLKYGIAVLLALPAAAVVLSVRPEAQASPESLPGYTLVFTVIALALAFFLLSALFDLVLVPSANLLLLDGALRRTQAPFWTDLGDAVRRGLARAKSLLLTYVFLVLVLLTSCLVFLPFLLVAWLADAHEIAAFGGLVALVAAGAAVGTFGLALPAVVLEHRTAVEAVERAWHLARLRPWTSSALGAAVVVAGLALSAFLSAFVTGLRAGGGHSQAAQLVAGVVWGGGSLLLDIAWSSILVSAYHGLVAEEACVVGRRSSL